MPARMAADAPGIRFPPPLLYAAGVLAGLAADRVLPLPRLHLVTGGVFLLLCGLALDAWAFVELRRARTTVLPWRGADALVTTGPYAFTRNPIYVGYALEHAGVALLLGSLGALLALPLVLLAVARLVVAREEAHLEARFGERYQAYRRKARRWL